jgi:hypothetical protein
LELCERRLLLSNTSTRGNRHVEKADQIDRRVLRGTFVIYSPPKIVSFSIDPHEHLVQVPLPVGINPELLDTPFADFGGEYRTKPVPPKANCFVANVDATFMQQVLYVAE